MGLENYKNPESHNMINESSQIIQKIDGISARFYYNKNERELILRKTVEF